MNKLTELFLRKKRGFLIPFCVTFCLVIINFFLVPRWYTSTGTITFSPQENINSFTESFGSAKNMSEITKATRRHVLSNQTLRHVFKKIRHGKFIGGENYNFSKIRDNTRFSSDEGTITIQHENQYAAMAPLIAKIFTEETLNFLQTSYYFKNESPTAFQISMPFTIPTVPSRPDPLKTSIFAFSISFVIGILGIFVTNFILTYVLKEKPLKKSMKIPFLGAISSIPQSDLISRSQEKPVSLIPSGGPVLPSDVISYFQPKSNSGKQFGFLASQVRNILKQRNGKVVLVTSPHDGAGKTTITLNLATAIAKETAKRVLLIDADFGKGDLTRKCKVATKMGFIDLVSGFQNINETLFEFPLRTLSLIPLGTPGLNSPKNIVKAKSLRTLFLYLKKHFDYVFIDSPAILNEKGMPLLTSFVDGTILVVHSSESSRQNTLKAYDRLRFFPRSSLIGFVSNEDKAAYTPVSVPGAST